MERATPAHMGRDRTLGVWVRLGRRLWSGLVNLLRAEVRPALVAADSVAAADPADPIAADPIAADPVSATDPDPADPISATDPELAEPEPTEPEPTAADPVGAADMAAAAAVTAATADLARRRPAQRPLISIVAVVPEWTPAVRAAVESVRAQSYSFWELVLVDTSHPPLPPPLVASGDGRVRVLLAPGADAATAHNRGLEAVEGQLLTALAVSATVTPSTATTRATTTMAPGWLAALAWAGGEWPGAGLFLGIRAFFTGAPGADPTTDLVRLVREGRAHLRPADSGADLGAVGQRRDGTELRWEKGGDPVADRLALALRRGDAHRLPVLATLSAESA